MNVIKRLELEWKILILASVLFVAFAWPLQEIFVNKLTATLEQSVDPNLEKNLRASLSEADSLSRSAAIASMERNRQWQALIPIIVREQRQAVFGFSLVLFFILFALALWTLKGLTRPLKNLARAVDKIGRGQRAVVSVNSGGALGTVERAVSELQDELDVLRDKARMQGMEKAWQDIARVMAHEIKNPLTPMRLTIDRLEEKTATGTDIDRESLAKFINRMNAQIDVLERLVNQFRSFSREPEASIRSVKLHDEIAAVAHDMEATITTTTNGTASISADPYLLRQVLLNIWKNSLEAGADTMNVIIENKGEKVRLCAKDNGPGVAKQDIDRVWLPYVSLKKGGAGLGLAVIKRLVETMGGQVALSSENSAADHGLTVILTFEAAVQGEVS